MPTIDVSTEPENGVMTTHDPSIISDHDAQLSVYESHLRIVTLPLHMSVILGGVLSITYDSSDRDGVSDISGFPALFAIELLEAISRLIVPFPAIPVIVISYTSDEMS